MLTTIKVLETLENKYNLIVSRELVFKYSMMGFFNPQSKRQGRPGKGLGVQTWWPDSVPGKIFVIKGLLTQNFKLTEISNYRKMIYNENFRAIIDNPVKSLEVAKLYEVAKFFAAAEAGIDFNKYSFSNNLHYEVYPNTGPLTVKLRDLKVLTELKKDKDFEWKPIKTVTFKNNQAIVS